MSKKVLYLAVYAIAVAGGKTVRPGKPIQLTDEQAERLLGKGAVTLASETEESDDITGDLMTLPEAEFEAAIAGLKLVDLKTIVTSHGMTEGDAKSKADFIAVIKAAREATK